MGRRSVRKLPLLLLVASVGCSPKPFAAKQIGDASQLSSGGTVPVIPASDKVDAACQTSAAYDACLFQKNPVAQGGAALATANDRGGAALLQTFGVKLTDLNSSGFLENSSIKVTTLNGIRLPLAQRARLKTSAGSEASTDIEQVMAYYYLNRAVDYWRARGPLAVNGAGITVMVDDTVAGFSSRDKSIHLLRNTNHLPMAFDASQMIYYLGMANAHLASNGAVNNFSGDNTHVLCGTDPRGCCSSNLGCGRAVVSGAAAYFTAVMFPAQTAIGEVAQNRVKGSQICNSWDNDPAAHANDTITTAGAACAGQANNVHALGLVYSSIWWSIRSTTSVNASEIDRLYLNHLSQLTAGDTFRSARDKILALDQSLFGGRHSTVINSEFSRRGI